MNNVDLYALALRAGCTPVWRNSAWHCTCFDHLHAKDLHSTHVTKESLQRKRNTSPYASQNPAKIVGECAACGHLYDVCRHGFKCDTCGHEGVSGARYENTAAATDMDPKTAMDVTILEAMYQLQDTRS